MSVPISVDYQLPAIGTRINHRGLLATVADNTGHQEWEGWLYVKYDKYAASTNGAWVKLGKFEVVDAPAIVMPVRQLSLWEVA